jgi:arsenite oxidase small subunit
VNRLTAREPDTNERAARTHEGSASVSRRRFLTVAGAASTVAVGATVAGTPTGAGAQPVAPPAQAPASESAGSGAAPTAYPRTPVAHVSDMQAGQVVQASYPDAESPILLLKVGSPTPDGVGPDGDIVGYSSFCTHMGCPVVWRPDAQILACPCHFSSFDPTRGGLQVIGQATTNLPQVVLEVSGDEVVATGMRGLVWGRQSNLQMFPG